MKKKLLIGIIAVVVLLLGWHLAATRISYTYQPVKLPATFDEFYKDKLARSKELKTRPKNEERLVKYAEKTPVAILYIHGFGASRAEGELVVDKVAKELKANTYYLRLPGHGTNVEDHAKATAKEHLDEAITTLKMMRKLGDKVIVIGGSMGGVVSTYIAAEYPELMDALVLASPAYQFKPALAKIAGFHPLFKLLSLIMVRRPTVASQEVPKEKDNWTNYWLTNQYTKSLKQLYDLQRLTNRDSILNKVTLPVLLIYYYKDEEIQDPTAYVGEMLSAYDKFNNGVPNAKSRKAGFDKGEHVLTGRFSKGGVEFDKVEKTLVDFIRSLGWSK